MTRRITWAITSLVAVGLARCVLTDYRVGTDAGDANAGTFTLDLAPPFVTMDPGDANVVVEIDVKRSMGFTGAVDFTIDSPIAIATPAPSVSPTGTTSSFALTLGPTNQRGDFTVVVHGKSGAVTADATLGLHIGSLLTPDDAGVLVLPIGARVVSIKAWGGGGGCGWYNGNNCTKGNSPGGGGGFAGGVFETDGGPTALSVFTATAGSRESSPSQGGGGGGYSGVRVGTMWWVVAGGGGGGSGASTTGGGAAGTGVRADTCAGTGGAAGGKAGTCNVTGGDGLPLQGGNGATFNLAGDCPGGAPGGGTGGATTSYPGGGGGGGGWIGGGGGAIADCHDNSGGGGSNYVDDAGADAFTAAGSGFDVPNTSDPDYLLCAMFTGRGCTVSDAFGHDGCIVIRLAKP